MRKRLAAIFCLALLGLALAGCSKCGPFWEDSAPHACHSDAPRG
jgi:predicted small lipoprotein YifL